VITTQFSTLEAYRLRGSILALAHSHQSCFPRFVCRDFESAHSRQSRRTSKTPCPLSLSQNTCDEFLCFHLIVIWISMIRPGLLTAFLVTDVASSRNIKGPLVSVGDGI
jgi:hypothetical protein